ncbi:MFS transporter [Streptosporangium sp. NPDC002607]
MTATTTRADRPRLVTRPFLGIAICGTVFFFASGMTIPMLPRLIVDDLGGGGALVGFIVGGMAVSSIIIRPWAPRFGESLGLKRTVLVGTLLASLSFIGYGIAPELVSLSLFRLITGLGQALFLVSAITLVTGIAPAERRGEAVSYFSIAPWLGIGVGPALGETIVQLAGIRGACLAAGALALVGVVAARLLPKKADEPGREELTERPGRLPRIQRSALGPGAVLALGMFGAVAFSTFLPLYTREIGVGGSQYVFLAYGMIILLLRLFGGRIPDRFGGAAVSTVATLLITVGLILIATVPTAIGLYGGTAVFATGTALQYPALLAFTVNRVPPAERAVAVATFTMFFDIAAGAGGALLGLVYGFGGYSGIFLAGAGCALLGLVLLHTWAAPRRGRRSSVPAPSPAD